MNRLIPSRILAVAACLIARAASAGVTAFSTNFDAGAPAQFSGVTTTESVQGYAGIGPAANQFGGKFLRNTTGGSPTGTASSPTTLVLTGLPAHTSINIGFLLAAIDTWDGSSSSAGAPVPDFFNVTVDGATIFSQTISNNNSVGTQTYNPPAGVLLTPSPYPELGFSIRPGNPPDFGDSAYNMGLDPDFLNIPHTSSTLTVSWFANGSGWQGGTDESWALDNVAIVLNGVPEPSSLAMLGIGAIVMVRRRRSTK